MNQPVQWSEPECPQCGGKCIKALNVLTGDFILECGQCHYREKRESGIRCPRCVNSQIIRSTQNNQWSEKCLNCGYTNSDTYS